MRHFYQFCFGSTFGPLFISLVIALSAAEFLPLTMGPIEPDQPTKEAVAITGSTTS